MIRIFCAIFLLLLLPSFGLADDSSKTILALPGPDDNSVIFLSYVFGVVNGLLHGTGSQIMGQMFAKFNSAILVLCGCVVIYTTIFGILNTAQEGQFLGQKFNSLFVPLRTVLGILLIVPTSTGYSWIQVIIMWIVLQGVSAGNMVWGAALKYILNGGVVITQNQEEAGANSFAQSLLRPQVKNMMSSVTCLQLTQHAIDQIVYSSGGKVKAPTQSTLQSVMNQVSTHGSKGFTDMTSTGASPVPMPYYQAATDPMWQPLTGICGSITNVNRANAVAVNQVILDLAAGTTNITNTCAAACVNVSSNGFKQSDCAPGSYLPNDGQSCGTVDGCRLFGYNAFPSTADLASRQTITNTNAMQTITTLNNGANSIGSFTVPVMFWCNPINWLTPNLSQTFNTADMDFLGLTYSIYGNDTSQTSTPMVDNFGHTIVANSRNAGFMALEDRVGTSWFNAGAYYFALLQANEGAQMGGSTQNLFKVAPDSDVAITDATNGFIFTQNSDGNFALQTKFTGDLANYWPIFAEWLAPFYLGGSGSMANNGLVKAFGTDVTPPDPGQTAQGQIQSQNYGHGPVVNFSVTNASGGGIMYVILNALLPGTFAMFTSFASMMNAQASNSNPMILMMMFGSGMVTVAMDIWFAVAGIIAAIAFGLGAIPCGFTFSSSMSPFATIISGFLNALLVPMFISGCMMLYYLPAVPFMIFTFGCIGWIVGVIEAMIAAPVVGFAIMIPDGGHDLFGRGDTGVMLMLNVFLRPPLMIFGLIAGIMISYIGVWMINDGFAQIIPWIMFAGSSPASLIVGLIAIPVVYMIMVMQVINRSFTLIYIFPDKITRWISGGQESSLGSEWSGAEKEAKQSAQSASGSMAEGFGKAGAAYKKSRAPKKEQGPKGTEVQGGDGT